MKHCINAPSVMVATQPDFILRPLLNARLISSDHDIAQ